MTEKKGPTFGHRDADGKLVPRPPPSPAPSPVTKETRLLERVVLFVVKGILIIVFGMFVIAGLVLATCFLGR